MSYLQIQSRYQGPLRDLQTGLRRGSGTYTDDTQLALAPAEALLDEGPGGDASGAIAEGYWGASTLPRRWLDKPENGKRGRDHAIALPDELLEPHATAS